MKQYYNNEGLTFSSYDDVMVEYRENPETRNPINFALTKFGYNPITILKRKSIEDVETGEIDVESCKLNDIMENISALSAYDSPYILYFVETKVKAIVESNKPANVLMNGVRSLLTLLTTYTSKVVIDSTTSDVISCLQAAAASLRINMTNINAGRAVLFKAKYPAFANRVNEAWPVEKGIEVELTETKKSDKQPITSEDEADDMASIVSQIVNKPKAAKKNETAVAKPAANDTPKKVTPIIEMQPVSVKDAKPSAAPANKSEIVVPDVVVLIKCGAVNFRAVSIKNTWIGTIMDRIAADNNASYFKMAGSYNKHGVNIFAGAMRDENIIEELPPGVYYCNETEDVTDSIIAYCEKMGYLVVRAYG